VELAISKDTFKVVNYSRVELEPGIIDEDTILLNPDAFKEAALKLIQEGHEGVIKSRNVIISIPEEKTFSHYLRIPAQDAEDYEGVVGHAKDLIPIELSEAAIDYKSLEQQKRDKKIVDFNFVAVQKSIIQPLITALQEAGLRVVAIDVDKNSLMRVCQACAVETANTMLIEVNYERSLLTVKNNCGLSHTLTLSMGEKMFLEDLKKDLNVDSAAKARALLREFGKSQGESSQKIQVRLNEFYGTLVKKAQELQFMIKNEDCPLISTFFIVELGLKWPGLKEALKKAFPKTEIIDQFDCIQVGQEDQRFYFNAIGLALRAVVPGAHETNINLLPHTKKEELHASEVRPKLRLGFLAIFLLVAGILFYSGLATAHMYFDYLVSKKELLNSIENVSNPYLAQAAQANQQKTQLESQVKAILENNLPAGLILRKLNDYNLKEGISLVNVRYQINLDGTMSLHIRAKTASRENTEAFILALEQEPLFAQVHSPLSNLVGKGERFIQLDITLDREVLMPGTGAGGAADLKEDVTPEENIADGETAEEGTEPASESGDADGEDLASQPEGEGAEEIADELDAEKTTEEPEAADEPAAQEETEPVNS